MKSFSLLFLISFSIASNSFSQTDIFKQKISGSEISDLSFETTVIDTKNNFNKFFVKNSTFKKDKNEKTSSTLPIAIGVWSFLYLLNPIIPFENDKIGLGITKEVSVGFGNFGEHRASFEYSYIFRKDLNSIIRLGYKYDILLKEGIKPSNIIQGTSVLSLGGGYFNNFSRPGYFAESSFGYSLRNDKFLFYPSLKLRYTYVAEGSNIVDFSFGIVIGIANPFIDLKIRNEH